MISDEIQKRLFATLKNNPKELAKEIENNPQILEFLLNSSREAELAKNDRVKYINMNQEMQRQLEDKSKELKVTQGILIGAGILLLLSLLEK